MEGFVLAVADNMQRGQGIYHALDQPPFLMPTYTPVFYVATALLISVFGLSFSVGRILSVAAALVTGLIIFVDSRRQTKEILIPLVATLFFFSLPVTYIWAPLVRVDSLAMSFGVGGLYFVHRRGGYSLPIACILFILAFYTKQNMVAAPLAALVYLWLRGERRRAVSLLLGLLALGSAVLLTCVAISGVHFLRHVFLYNINEVRWETFLALYPRFFRDHFLFITTGIVYALLCFTRGEVRLPLLYFLLAGVSTLGVIKLGASVNYFYEFGTACCLMVTPIVADSRRSLGRINKTYLLPLIPLLLLLQGLFLYHQPHRYNLEFLGETPRDVFDPSKEQVVAFLKKTSGPIIAINPEFALFSGRDVYIEPLFYTLMAKYGYWDESDFIQELRNKKFSAIVVPFDMARPETTKFKYVFFAQNCFDAEMTRAILHNYSSRARFGDYHILLPRPRTKKD